MPPECRQRRRAGLQREKRIKSFLDVQLQCLDENLVLAAEGSVEAPFLDAHPFAQHVQRALLVPGLPKHSLGSVQGIRPIEVLFPRHARRSLYGLYRSVKTFLSM